MLSRYALPLVLACFLAAPVLAQQGLTVPRASPHASVSQRVGLTDITVDYHRPAVNGRAVWGGLVPYDQVWRAGANENTAITFSSPVRVGGERLDAGTYGFHLIPTESGPWTAIFSTMADAWGSFSYDASEDAARVAVTPRSAAMTERLLYRFDDPDNQGTTLVLAWDEMEVPVRIEVDTPAVVLANMEREMRGLPRFSWQGWNQIAQWALQNDLKLDEARGWAERSVGMNRNFANLMTLAAAQEKLGDAAAAEALRAEALPMANEAQMNAYGYQLLGQGRTAEAVAIFRKNVEDHPESWNVYDSLGEGLAAHGERDEAVAMYKKARSMAPQAQHGRIDGVLAQLEGAN